MYRDEDNGETKGEMVNYALCCITNYILIIVIEPSYYEEACSNGIWMQAMEENDAIERNDTWGTLWVTQR